MYKLTGPDQVLPQNHIINPRSVVVQFSLGSRPPASWFNIWFLPQFPYPDDTHGICCVKDSRGLGGGISGEAFDRSRMRRDRARVL